MRLFFKIFFLGLLFFSCEKYNMDIESPSVSFTYFPINPKVGDSITFNIDTNADFLSIYTGDSLKKYETSRVKALIENDFETFYDSVYRKNLSGGLPTKWYRYLKDYSSLSDVEMDFQFYGAIENIDLGVYNNFPQSLIKATYPDKNVLKFTVSDRTVNSGIIFQPNIYVFGKGMDPAFSQFEIRFVSSEEDKVVRRVSGNKDIIRELSITIYDVETNEEHTATKSFGNFMTYETDDPMTARTSPGFINIGQFMEQEFDYYLENPEKGYIKEVKFKLNGELARKGNQSNGFYYDFNGGEYYREQLDPVTGLPINENDYIHYRGFQGDVYLSWIEFGTDEYEPFSLGKSLGSIYDPKGLNKNYKYAYNKEGEYNVTVVATNTGRKLYSEDGYQTNRRLSYDDYQIKRSISQQKLNISK